MSECWAAHPSTAVFLHGAREPAEPVTVWTRCSTGRLRVLDEAVPLVRPLAEVAAGTPIVYDANIVERMPAASRRAVPAAAGLPPDRSRRFHVEDGVYKTGTSWPSRGPRKPRAGRRFVRIDERHVELRPESHNPVHDIMKLDLAKHILQFEGIAVGALIGELRDVRQEGDRGKGERPDSPRRAATNRQRDGRVALGARHRP